jgi:hypothetical protein
MARKTYHKDADGSKKEGVDVEIGRMPTLTDDVLLEFGRKLIFDSIALATEFNKTMLGLTATFTTLMASLFSLLAFGLKDVQLNSFQRLILAIPVILMLMSSVSFALGFLPQPENVNLSIINTIEAARNRLLQSKRNFAFIGTGLFCLSIILLISGVLLFNIIQ